MGFAVGTLGLGSLVVYFEWKNSVLLEKDRRKLTFHHFLYHDPRPSFAGIEIPAIPQHRNARREWLLRSKDVGSSKILTLEVEACSPCGYANGRTATWRRYSSLEEYQKSSLLPGGPTTIEDVPIWVDTDALNTVLLEQKFYDAWRGDIDKN